MQRLEIKRENSTGKGRKGKKNKKEKQYKEKVLNKGLKRRQEINREQQAGICKKQGQKVIER